MKIFWEVIVYAFCFFSSFVLAHFNLLLEALLFILITMAQSNVFIQFRFRIIYKIFIMDEMSFIRLNFRMQWDLSFIIWLARLIIAP